MDRYDIEYKRVYRVPYHRLPGSPHYLSNRYTVPNFARADALHLFNGVCVSPRRWISSIEMEYPRYFCNPPPAAFDEAYSSMLSKYCRALLPLSETASQLLMRKLPADVARQIASKVHVFSGGVAIPASCRTVRRAHLEGKSDAIRLAFIGRTFWHKGGPAVIKTAEELRRHGIDATLLVVSALETSSTAYSASAEEVRAVRTYLRSRDWIEFHEGLTNEATLAKLAQCDLLLFPTLDETLGWVAIEAAGLGVPVISTNVFALPEIVADGVTGRLIPLQLNADYRWIGIPSSPTSVRSRYDEAITYLGEACIRIVSEFLDHPLSLEEMGAAALRRYEERFSPAVASQRLGAILENSLE